jgi:hypothetical protein
MYTQAKNTLHKMPRKTEFVEEHEVERFADGKEKIDKHGE